MGAIRYGHFLETTHRVIRICRDNTASGVSFQYPNNPNGAARAGMQMRRLAAHAREMERNCLFQEMFSRANGAK